MSNCPKVSVLMAVHNGMPYLPGTVESILAQTFRDFELLVVDDGSTDESGRCVQAFADPRIHYHRLERVGFCEALNHGLEKAQASLVARIDADDVAYPTRLAVQYRHMIESPACTVLGCQADEIDMKDEVVGKRVFPLSDAVIRWSMAFGCPFLHPGVMYRRDAVHAAGGYKSITWPAEDYDLWTRMSDRGMLANHPETLMKYRVWPEGVTHRHTKDQIDLCGKIAARYAAGKFPELRSEALAELYYFLCSDTAPVQSNYSELARTYACLKKRFLEGITQANLELETRIHDTQQMLRWRCLERAEREWHAPWHAWFWLRLAGRFDPENGTVGKLVWRGVRKALRRGQERQDAV